MKTITDSALVLGAIVCLSVPAAAQTPVGALAIDERQGDQYGWAVDYETAAAAGTRALSECGSGCSVVLTFGRCAAYAADQDADSTAVGWAESFASADGARQAALGECGSRGGTGCIVRVWGCNSHVVEEGLGLDRAARREIQDGLEAAGFDPGGTDGMFGPRTRSAIRSWQTSRGARATGYLDGASVAVLRPSVAGQTTFRARTRAGAAATLGAVPAAPPAVSAAPQQPPPASAEVELVFWQSIADSTNPAEFAAYLRRFPNGMFSDLAQIRLEALRSPGGNAPVSARSGVGGGDARPQAGTVFRPAQTCAGQPAGTSCWMEISGRLGCYVWNPNPQPDETVTWTGECRGGLAQGTGSVTWVSDGNEQVVTGRRQDGKSDGHTVVRDADGTVLEGLVVAGEQHGDWTVRRPTGETSVYRFENGELVEFR